MWFRIKDTKTANVWRYAPTNTSSPRLPRKICSLQKISAPQTAHKRLSHIRELAEQFVGPNWKDSKFSFFSLQDVPLWNKNKHPVIKGEIQKKNPDEMSKIKKKTSQKEYDNFCFHAKCSGVLKIAQPQQLASQQQTCRVSTAMHPSAGSQFSMTQTTPWPPTNCCCHLIPTEVGFL